MNMPRHKPSGASTTSDDDDARPRGSSTSSESVSGVEPELVEDREHGQRARAGRASVRSARCTKRWLSSAPSPVEHEDRRERHRQRIRRIAEEPHEPLDHRDLEEHEAEPERGEVDRRDALGRERAPLPAHERRTAASRKTAAYSDGDPEQQQQHALADDVFGVVHVERLDDVAQDVAERREVPEERRVVGDRA